MALWIRCSCICNSQIKWDHSSYFKRVGSLAVVYVQVLNFILDIRL